MSVVIGWDIGGAHLKAARVKARARRSCGSGGDAALARTRQPRRRVRCASRSARPRRPSRDHHDRRIVRRLSLAPGGRRGSGCDRGQSSRPAQPRASTPAGPASSGLAKPLPTPSTSPRPIGTRAPRSSRSSFRDALFIDIGSTTTDLIPVVAGRVAAVGYSDAERLAAGELIYTGMTRSFVMSLASRAPFRGAWTPLMNEYFASSADVHRILGDLPDGADKMATADGREKTVEASRARLARMIGREADEGRARNGTDSPPGSRKRKYARLPTRRRCACPATMSRSRRRSSRRASGKASRRKWRAACGGLRRIFFADRGPRGSLALRARGRGRIACRESGSASAPSPESL